MSLDKKTILNYICCPICKSDVSQTGTRLTCKTCGKIFTVSNGYVRMMSDSTNDIKLSIRKWDELYKKQFDDQTFYQDFKVYKERYFDSVYSQIKLEKKLSKNSIYLEIGCGPFFIGQLIANECKMIVGVDFCPHALMIAKKMLDEKSIKNYLLIQADILALPVKSNTVDLIYGGGVIEHFNDTKKCLSELYRVTKQGGVSINTVPCLNIGSLTYRQVWGNIPNFPVLRQFAEFIHIHILRGKHMVFGYELSFLPSHLTKLHTEAKFRKTTVKNFEIEPEFNFIPKTMRAPFVYLAKKSPLFWPMIKVSAFK
ncbi:MAG: putative methyltransferase [Candidatus Collierbacteria bacterium GW2011_GWC2_44_18]|uniref:Putative methyltransferase n=1 Tax=Candidatus Collierbacteria bacterium GW2011_GWC2_44_18 TaxID=1618392 RepID=A0A0G1K076_9BACT|nr:MAG: putative methyltransferase [Candidatus Collierbacteria bacterium GW2011_GWC2_44_18]